MKLLGKMPWNSRCIVLISCFYFQITLSFILSYETFSEKTLNATLQYQGRCNFSQAVAYAKRWRFTLITWMYYIYCSSIRGMLRLDCQISRQENAFLTLCLKRMGLNIKILMVLQSQITLNLITVATYNIHLTRSEGRSSY